MAMCLLQKIDESHKKLKLAACGKEKKKNQHEKGGTELNEGVLNENPLHINVLL